MYNLHVIGVSDENFSSTQKNLLADCDHLFATKRLQVIATDLPLTIHDISPLQSAIDGIKEKLNSSNVAVLASGDPLFYGIGKRLIKEIGAEKIQFHPALSSIQRAAALCKVPWDDATVLSLHGRQHPHPAGQILLNKKTLLLTDSTNNPQTLCQDILDYLDEIEEQKLPDKIEVKVAENIGLPDQRLFSGTLEEAAACSFASLNVLFIERPEEITPTEATIFGLTEDEVVHSRGLITKSEVRAATIHQLRLPATGIFWDVGAGSGSVSIEAARIHPGLCVFAVEHKPEEIANIKANIRKFGCYNVIPIYGRAPEVLADLPDPDRIFVGGSSGTLPEITTIAKERLPENGRIVINGVIEKTIRQAPEQMKRHDFTVQTSTIQVTRTVPGEDTVTFNPITITTGIK